MDYSESGEPGYRQSPFMMSGNARQMIARKGKPLYLAPDYDDFMDRNDAVNHEEVRGTIIMPMMKMTLPKLLDPRIPQSYGKRFPVGPARSFGGTAQSGSGKQFRMGPYNFNPTLEDMTQYERADDAQDTSVNFLLHHVWYCCLKMNNLYSDTF